MKKIARNDPCPCGSGLKYKKCCLQINGGFQPYTADERASALQKMDDFVDQGRWQEYEDEAMNMFWNDLEQNLPQLDDYVHFMSESMFDFWFCFDFKTDDDRPLFHYFLDGSPSLTKGELSFINMAGKSCVRLYEAVEVIPGKSITLKDLISGRVTEVREIRGSQSMKRHEILAARIMPVGASGRPEMDGGLFLFPRMQRERIVNTVKSMYEAFNQETPGAADPDFYKEMPPVFHQMWLPPFINPIPDVVTRDGHKMVITKVYFDVDDPDALKAVLDTKKDLERETEALKWTWLSKTKDGRTGIYGFFSMEGQRLILETSSKEWGEKGKEKINRIAKDLARYKITKYTSMQSLLEKFKSGKPGPEPGFGDLSPADREKLDQTIKDEQKKYYKKWLDMDIPMLDGHTPRQAARSPELKPRIIEMLKDLEHHYESDLTLGKPGFDPSWMWEELGLESENPDRHQGGYLPLTGFEAMGRLVEGMGDVARKIAAGYRHMDTFDDTMTLDREDLKTNLDFQRFVREQTILAVEQGMDRQMAEDHGNLLASHLEYMVNYELHLRKTFWIDPSLSYMLEHTRLDLPGDMLKLPYSSFALVFTDRFTLETAERLLSKIPDCIMGGRKLQIMTVYVTQILSGETKGLRIAFDLDAFIEQWPYLLVRDLKIDPRDSLDQILVSHFPDAEDKGMDPVFRSELMRKMVHLVINTILYTTSADVATETRAGSQISRTKQGSGTGQADNPFLSSQEVIYLPGKIKISLVKEMQAVEKSESGRKLMVKFMVRGHWRRANSKWKDHRPRWISPYWKGPDLATIIERQYRLTT
ncbi:MAG: SEC-C domain-containing protein [Pseudomonadota bacterium]